MNTFFLSLLGLMQFASAEFRGSVVYIVAHPDDETMMGGTLGRLKEQNIPVYGIYITRGEGGKINKVTGNAADNYHMRPQELKKAAEFYGVKEVLLLNQPDQPLRDKDGIPTKNVNEFMEAKVWNKEWIKSRIKSYLDVIHPKLILTLDPHAMGIIHAHHQAAAHLALEISHELKDKKRIAGIYGVFEAQQYPNAKFKFSKKTITFNTKQSSTLLGMTYQQFQAEGSKFHATQNIGHMGILNPPEEKWEPLAPENDSKVFKNLLKIDSKHSDLKMRTHELRMIEEQESK